MRLDKWLWQARFCKSRSVAARLCRSGIVRINRQATDKAHALVRPGDMLTFPLGERVRVVEVLALGDRRGPSSEAQALYADHSPPAQKHEPPLPPAAEREPGAGRPTKRDRRRIDRLTLG